MKQHLLWVAVMVLFTAFPTYAQTDSCGYGWLQKRYDTLYPGNALNRAAKGNRVQHYRENSSKLISGHIPGTPSGGDLTGACTRTRYLIPVVVHIDTTDTANNIPDHQVHRQIAVLNNTFLGSQIQFCLAQKRPDGTSFSGINRIAGPGTSDRISKQLAQLAQLAYYNPNEYLNIYVVKDILDDNGSATGVSGYNNIIPGGNGLDAVVVRREKFGDYTDCPGCKPLVSRSRGFVLVHETGHYLGLEHPWTGGCAAGNTAATCGLQGDFCCDTRSQSGEVYNCDTIGKRSCPTYHLNIDDDLTNYMNYVQDSCMSHFTPDQMDVMYSTLEGPRSGLVSPLSVNAKQLSCCMASAFFTASDNLLCFNGTITFTALEYSGSASYRWILRDSVNTTVKDTVINNNHEFTYLFTLNNRYSVELEIDFGGSMGKVKFGRQDFITKLNCNQPLRSIHANWYFGRYAGLNFTTVGAIRDLGPSRFRPINVNTSEGTYGTSNPFGRLLFYAAARPIFDSVFNFQPYVDVYNRNYQIASPDTMYGFEDASQGGVVVPMPGNSSKYYIFTVSTLTGFHYSVFDTTLNSGLGGYDPSAIDVPVYAVPGSANFIDINQNDDDSAWIVGEGISAIPKCNGRDYWIIANDASGVDYTGKQFPNNDKILVFTLDSTGLTFSHVLNYKVTTTTMFKFSPDGSRLVAFPYVFDFDRQTGTVTLVDSLPIGVWGTSFSPNSNVLYYLKTTNGQNTSFTALLVQVDLLNADTAVRTQLISDFYYPNYMGMQLGPDNKIYLSRIGVGQLAVINSPDEIVTTAFPNKCGFTDNGPLLSVGGIGGECQQGLPNNVDAKLPDEIPLDFTHADSACLFIKFRPSKCCATTYKWQFGDGDSSALQYPAHTYADTGSYMVTLTVNGTLTVQKEVYIGIRSGIAGDGMACVFENNSIGYFITGKDDETDYTWDVTNGSKVVDAQGNLIVLWDGSSTGIVTLEAMKAKTGCSVTWSRTITINYLDSNYIWVDTGACYLGNRAELQGNATTSNLGTVLYQWQSSPDGINWNNIDTAGSLQNYTGIIPDTAGLWFRRIASYDSCKAYSNAIRMKPWLYIKRQPQDYVSCPGGTRAFSIELQKPSGVATTSKWNYQLKGTTSWSALFYLGDSIYDWPTSIAYDSAKYRCTITTPCGNLISDTGYVLIQKIPNIISQPQSQTKAEGDSVVFIVSDSAIQPFYVWYVKRNGAQGWDSIPGEHNDTLIIRNLTACENKNRYRVSTTACGDTSNSAVLTVTSLSDLWSRDGINDTGIEPNTATANDYWASPDLWNCWPDSTCTTHESPEYVSVDWNYARTVVRNAGTATSEPFEVKMYWTLGGFYEQWPKSWHYDTVNNGFYNPGDGRSYPMGGEIGSYSSAGLGAGAAKTINMQWAPPYPGWYDTSRFFNAGRLSHPLCMLSRIVACVDTPFGMTFPEIIPTGHNVINNNNIVTRNTEVYDSIGFNKTTPEWVLRMGNQWEGGRKIRLTIDNTVSNFWDLGYYMVRLAPEIHTAWVEGGSVGGGYTLGVSDSIFYVYDDGFYLDNIVLDSGEWGWVHFQFRLDEETEITESRGNQLFSFVQYSSPTEITDYQPDGGFNFLLSLQLPPPPHIDSLQFTISPNPANTPFVNLLIDANFSATGTINIYDGLGNPMITPQTVSISDGLFSETVYIAGVSSGFYTMVISANGHNYSEGIIIL